MGLPVKRGLQAVTVAVVAGLLGLLIWKVAHQDKGVKLGGGRTPPAPGFALARLDGPGKLELASLRGRVVVLNFWASWCAPCKSEAPRLEAAWQRYRRQGVIVLGVDGQDFSGDAKRFMRKHGITYPNVHDGPGNIGSKQRLQQRQRQRDTVVNEYQPACDQEHCVALDACELLHRRPGKSVGVSRCLHQHGAYGR